MRKIPSSLTGKQGMFDTLREVLREDQFTLSNWEYEYGFFDKQLDMKAMVFLRLPIDTVSGELDDPAAVVQFGHPFVLKHVYQTGNDPDIGYASGPAIAASFNQFQEPQDKDAEVEDDYVEMAKQIVRRLEQKLV
ncbi:YugN family protein [Brevibacillus fluminis]|uniref:YugN family protein n=1 Tax=Brevibacillus fluminis TaxID=511487 RepID=UPI003F8B244D